ncbi:MAG: DUF5060 domain-containing protein, partial [Bacteroidetes bacterium]|nr:DUF5060 domain-containing protein [Bacteroidota bacterium]
YAVYLPIGTKEPQFSLEDSENTYSVEWYNPRAGGQLINGNITEISGMGIQPLGNPPVDPEKDWVVLIRMK